MPRKVKALSDLEVKRLAKRAGFHAVGGVWGLYLQTDPPAASWILYTRVGESRRKFGLGSYPEISLGEARQRARDHRSQIGEGIDPREAKRAAKAALAASQARVMTFKDAARQCHKFKASEFRNVKHGKDWLTSLDTYAFPKLGHVPVADVDLPQVLAVLQPIWTDKTETATRVRQRIEAVLAWAKASGYREAENAARWKENLEFALPRPAKVKRVTHHAALPWAEVPQFMADLRKRDGMGARALEFAILTWARSGEVRLATWDEIDLAEKLWTVPAERMKGGKVHRVPLSVPAVKLLEALPRMEGSDYVFHAVRGGPLSDMSISAVCRRMESPCVPHGFRASAKDWARSSTAYADEVSELALAHVSSDATRAAYARDELLAKRAKLMTAWAKFCATLPKQADVQPIRGRKHG